MEHKNDLLAAVEKPSRYLGIRNPPVHKDPGTVQLRIALAFPDLYEIGTSHFGLQILYQLLNAMPAGRRRAGVRPGRRHGSAAAPAGPAALLARVPHPARAVRHRRLQPALRAELHQRAHHARSGRDPAARRGPRHRAPAGDRRRPVHLQPRTDGGLFRRDGGWGRRGNGRASGRGLAAVEGGRRSPRRESLLRRWAEIPGVYIPAFFEPRHDDCRVPDADPAPGGVHPGEARHRGGPERSGLPADPGDPVRQTRARPAATRNLPGLHPGVSLLPGRDALPAGAGALSRTGCSTSRRHPSPRPGTRTSR